MPSLENPIYSNEQLQTAWLLSATLAVALKYVFGKKSGKAHHLWTKRNKTVIQKRNKKRNKFRLFNVKDWFNYSGMSDFEIAYLVFFIMYSAIIAIINWEFYLSLTLAGVLTWLLQLISNEGITDLQNFIATALSLLLYISLFFLAGSSPWVAGAAYLALYVLLFFIFKLINN